VPSIECSQCEGEEAVVLAIKVPYLDPTQLYQEQYSQRVVETLKEMGLDIRREKGAE
jgi:hypothetical protein